MYRTNTVVQGLCKTSCFLFVARQNILAIIHSKLHWVPLSGTWCRNLLLFSLFSTYSNDCVCTCKWLLSCVTNLSFHLLFICKWGISRLFIAMEETFYCLPWCPVFLTLSQTFLFAFPPNSTVETCLWDMHLCIQSVAPWLDVSA